MIIIMVWVTDFASIFISNTKNSHCHYISNQFSNFFFFFFEMYSTESLFSFRYGGYLAYKHYV